MMTFYKITIVICINLIPLWLCGQINFRADLEANDPAPRKSELTQEEREKVHNEYLTNLPKEETESILYAHMYCFTDRMRRHNYVEAAEHLLQAEMIAKSSKNNSWLGSVLYKKGSSLYSRTDKHEDALIELRKAVKLCKMAGDSLCYGESLEQMASSYAYFEKFDSAHIAYNQAFRLLIAHGEKRHLATAYGNYGILFLHEHRPKEAIHWIRTAMAIHKELDNNRSWSAMNNNLAAAQRHSGDLESAIETFKSSISFNTKHGLSERMINNHLGLYFVYLDQEDYKSALNSIENYEHLKDSLYGIKVQEKITLLEAKYNKSQLELDLNNSQLNLKETQNTVLIAVGIALLLLGGFLFVLYSRKQKIKTLDRERKYSREKLSNLQSLLMSKNKTLTDLERQLESKKEYADIQAAEVFNSIENQKILTSEDWIDFKEVFNKAYPKYLYELRAKHPELTESYERLFLLIKLNLKKDEIANILGVSKDSVKKTRSRLRKSLSLSPDESLEKYISEF